MPRIHYRDCAFDRTFSNLCRHWNHSKSILTQLHRKLDGVLANPGISVSVAGSFGRYEAGDASDLDFLIIAEDNADTRDVYNHVVRAATELKVTLPNPDGVFSRVVPLSDLIRKLGDKEEKTSELAQRLLLLLEATPLHNAEFHDQAVNAILERYLDLHRESPQREAVILLNDLIKYFRHVCVNYQNNFWRPEEKDKWGSRNIKLRHSRVIMYAGLLLPILNASRNKENNVSYENKVRYFRDIIAMTPLERIVHVMAENGYDPTPVLACYDHFIGLMNQRKIRDALVGVEYLHRGDNRAYGVLKKNSDELLRYLTDFVLDMRGVWSHEAFEYLIF